MGSIDTKNSLKEMAKTNQDESIQLVLSLLEKVNANQSDFATADSKAVNKVHTELQNVCQVIKRFLEYSTDIVSKEGMCCNTRSHGYMPISHSIHMKLSS